VSYSLSPWKLVSLCDLWPSCSSHCGLAVALCDPEHLFHCGDARPSFLEAVGAQGLHTIDPRGLLDGRPGRSAHDELFDSLGDDHHLINGGPAEVARAAAGIAARPAPEHAPRGSGNIETEPVLPTLNIAIFLFLIVGVSWEDYARNRDSVVVNFA
jgi:hypothetical protein